jgi:hypothetical protein
MQLLHYDIPVESVRLNFFYCRRISESYNKIRKVAARAFGKIKPLFLQLLNRCNCTFKARLRNDRY